MCFKYFSVLLLFPSFPPIPIRIAEHCPYATPHTHQVVSFCALLAYLNLNPLERCLPGLAVCFLHMLFAPLSNLNPAFPPSTPPHTHQVLSFCALPAYLSINALERYLLGLAVCIHMLLQHRGQRPLDWPYQTHLIHPSEVLDDLITLAAPSTPALAAQAATASYRRFTTAVLLSPLVSPSLIPPDLPSLLPPFTTFSPSPHTVLGDLITLAAPTTPALVAQAVATSYRRFTTALASHSP
ncbi:unnamed protein product [Closterium sp. Naga37s-1]|nr:unnamed protein product [Closterium sp. Naga37s-1]